MIDSDRSKPVTKGRTHPKWYGARYPKWSDLEELAEDWGCLVIMSEGRVPCFSPGDENLASSIFVPQGFGLLAQFWALAHELGHLALHVGPRGALLYSMDEARADVWAASALIPKARIQSYANASPDAFIGALSAHYEDLPLEDCPARSLAAQIAALRLHTLAQEVS